MYLTELYRFYERMTQDPQSGMPPEGMSAEAIHFALVIGEDGCMTCATAKASRCAVSYRRP